MSSSEFGPVVAPATLVADISEVLREILQFSWRMVWKSIQDRKSDGYLGHRLRSVLDRDIMSVVVDGTTTSYTALTPLRYDTAWEQLEWLCDLADASTAFECAEQELDHTKMMIRTLNEIARDPNNDVDVSDGCHPKFTTFRQSLLRAIRALEVLRALLTQRVGTPKCPEVMQIDEEDQWFLQAAMEVGADDQAFLSDEICRKALGGNPSQSKCRKIRERLEARRFLDTKQRGGNKGTRITSLGKRALRYCDPTFAKLAHVGQCDIEGAMTIAFRHVSSRCLSPRNSEERPSESGIRNGTARKTVASG